MDKFVCEETDGEWALLFTRADYLPADALSELNHFTPILDTSGKSLDDLLKKHKVRLHNAQELLKSDYADLKLEKIDNKQCLKTDQQALLTKALAWSSLITDLHKLGKTPLEVGSNGDCGRFSLDILERAELSGTYRMPHLFDVALG